MRLMCIAIVLLLGVSADASAQATAPFPHEKHVKLFPLCESCHAGVASGNTATAFPPEASCSTCHNGTDSKVVQWIRPTRGAGLLRYSHPEHAAKVDSAGRACGTCHGMPDQPMMVVRRASP
ncbi:MAG: cytochrome c3 family protein, partial [Gemmatimonadota bacterium]